MPAAAIPHAVSLLAAASFHEKSKTAFYILAGLLAAWAVALAFGGLSRSDFPATRELARLVMAVSILLPVATATAAVLTAAVPPPAPAFATKRAPVNGAKGQVPPPTPVASAGAQTTGGSAAGAGAGGAGAGATASAGAGKRAGGAAGAGAGKRAGGAAGAGAAKSTEIDADPSGQLAFVQKSVALGAGKATIKFVNMAPVPHNLTIQQGSGATGTTIAATPTFAGNSQVLTTTLKPGTYTFYCAVPGHRQAGMQGTITVK